MANAELDLAGAWNRPVHDQPARVRPLRWWPCGSRSRRGGRARNRQHPAFVRWNLLVTGSTRGLPWRPEFQDEKEKSDGIFRKGWEYPVHSTGFKLYQKNAH